MAAYSMVPVALVCNVVLGKMVSSTAKTINDVEQPYIHAANIRDNGVLDMNHSVRSMWFSPSEAISLSVRAGDVFLAEGGACGKPAFVTRDFTGYGFQNSVLRVRPFSSASDSKFLFYAFFSAYKDGQFAREINTVSIAHLPGEKLNRFRIPLPPLEAQHHIADYLDRETTKIDTLVAELDEYVKLLEKRRRALITDAVRGRVCTDDGMTLNTKSDCDAFDKRVSLYHYAVVNPLTPKFQTLAEGTKVPFLPLENIWAFGKGDQTEIREWRKADTSYTQFANGDILSPKVTPTVFHGRSMLTSIPGEIGLATSEVHVLRCKNNADPRWVAYNLLSGKFLDEARKDVKGVGGLQRISTQYLQTYKVALTPLETQRSIADYLDRETLRMDELVSECKELKALLLKRRQVLITDVVTGKVEV